MKAVRINQWAQPVEIEELPQPTPSHDEVLVKVHAASLNPIDAMVAAGYLQFMLTVPMSAGNDFAGEVVEVGADVTHVKPGDAVYGLIRIRGGAFAEYAVAKANEVALKPQSLDYVQAATVPLPALTAWQSLFEHGQAKSGDTVVIHGAGGAVGSFAIQLAKDQGIHTIASDLPEKMAFLQELDADEILNAKERRFEEVVKDADVVIHLVPGEDMEPAYSAVKPGGNFVTTIMEPPQPAAEKHGIKAMLNATTPSAENLEKLAALIDAGKLKVFVNRTFPLDEVQAAYAYRQALAEPGKVVLTISDN